MKLPAPLALLLVTVAAASAQSIDSTISGPLSYIPQPFDVLHYDAEIDLTQAPTRQMSGRVSILIRWTPGDEQAAYFAFHLRSLVIDSVLYEGSPVVVTTVGESSSPTYHHRFTPPERPDVGDSATVTVFYHGTMTDEVGSASWGGVSSSDSTLFGMGVGLANNYVSATQHWLACYDHPSDKATFRGRFRSIGGNFTASNGVLASSTEGDTTIHEWTTSIATSTYLLTFATARYARLDFGSDPVPMMVYSLARDSGATRESFRLLPRMVRAFTERFIPYPFEKVGYVNTPIGAMEHQTMISIATSTSRSRDTVNRIAAHELAHQWFGDLVTPPDFRHVWLTESFATYCESIWAEDLFGYPGYLVAQDRAINRYILGVAPREGIFPMYDFPRAAPSSNYPETIYQKGAAVVGMLRYEMGDSAFFQAMRDYLTTYAFTTATTEQMLRALEIHHGSSLDWFFDQWVFGKGWPKVDVRVSNEEIGGGYVRVTLDVDQTPIGDERVYRRLAVPIRFESPGDTSASRDRVVVLDAASQTFVLDSVPAYQTVRLNAGRLMRSLFTSGTVSGIESAADSGDVSFFVKPNPTDGTAALIVQVKGTDECESIRYELYDASGRRLGMGTSDRCEFTIPTDGFASGAYVLRFRFRGVFYDVSIVVAR